MSWQILFLLVATAAASEGEVENEAPRCRISIYRECEQFEDVPKEMPGTAEELEKFCKLVTKYFNCSERVMETCDANDEIPRQYIRDIASNVRRVCNEDPLLYNALAAIVPCLKQNMNEINSCHLNFENDSKSFSEALVIIGITDGDSGGAVGKECLNALYGAGCTAATGGRFCGEVARRVLINLIQGIDATFKQACPPGVKERLPEIAMVLQSEDEVEEAVE